MSVLLRLAGWNLLSGLTILQSRQHSSEAKRLAVSLACLGAIGPGARTSESEGGTAAGRTMQLIPRECALELTACYCFQRPCSSPLVMLLHVHVLDRGQPLRRSCPIYHQPLPMQKAGREEREARARVNLDRLLLGGEQGAQSIRPRWGVSYLAR